MAGVSFNSILILGFVVHGCICIARCSEDQSINEIVEKEFKPALLHQEHHHYYLPQQTVFDTPGGNPLHADASKTLPPHITINPTAAFKDQLVTEEPAKDDYTIPYTSYCISETISEAKAKSDHLLPSKDMHQKSTVLSGYIETPSKTSDDLRASEISNTVSISSDLVEESEIFVGNTSTSF